MKVNEQRLNQFVDKAVNDLAAGYGGVMVALATSWVFTGRWPVRGR